MRRKPRDHGQRFTHFLSSKVCVIGVLDCTILCFVGSFENRKLLVLQTLKIPCFVPEG